MTEKPDRTRVLIAIVTSLIVGVFLVLHTVYSKLSIDTTTLGLLGLLVVCLLIPYIKSFSIPGGPSIELGNVAKGIRRASRGGGQPIPPGRERQVLANVKTNARTIAGKRVLWVDDQPSNNLGERAALRAMQICVDLAWNTDEAFILLDSDHYDLIISDVKRPEGDVAGITFASSVSKNPRSRGIPLIIYTLNYRTQERNLPGIDAIVYSPDELIDHVVRLLTRAEATDTVAM